MHRSDRINYCVRTEGGEAGKRRPPAFKEPGILPFKREQQWKADQPTFVLPGMTSAETKVGGKFLDSQYHFWACALTCSSEIEDILLAWNEAGPWRWELRERYFFGTYLNARPAEGLRIQLHEFSQDGGFYTGPGTVDGFRYDRGYTVQFELPPNCLMGKEEINEVFRGLLDAIAAENVNTIDPYA